MLCTVCNAGPAFVHVDDLREGPHLWPKLNAVFFDTIIQISIVLLSAQSIIRSSALRLLIKLYLFEGGFDKFDVDIESRLKICCLET